MTVTTAIRFSGKGTTPAVASTRCLLFETREHVQAVVVLRYALDPPDRAHSRHGQLLPSEHAGIGICIFQGEQFLGAGASPAIFTAVHSAR